MSKRAYSIRIFGAVQGVFFRAHAKAAAERLHLSGYAQNQADGSVLIEIEGDEAQINEFLAWCREGSPKSEVADMEITAAKPGSFESFEIR